MTPTNRFVLALDFEGTLVSNAVSLFARPHLFDFLEWTRTRFERTVLYTAVTGSREADQLADLVHEAIERLAAVNDVPAWFVDIEIFIMEGQCKDLRRVAPDLDRLLLADDQEGSVCPEQRQCWVPVEPWLPPYSEDDEGLGRLQARLERAIAQAGRGS